MLSNSKYLQCFIKQLEAGPQTHRRFETADTSKSLKSSPVGFIFDYDLQTDGSFSLLVLVLTVVFYSLKLFTA